MRSAALNAVPPKAAIGEENAEVPAFAAEGTLRIADPARTGFAPADRGKMWWDHRVGGILSQAGLSTFDEVMTHAAGRCVRFLADREVWHFRMRAPAQSERGMYLKRHRLRTWQGRLRSILGLAPPRSPGRVEAENVRRLSNQGIAVMQLLAYGEKLHADGLQESFVITEELEGFTMLTDYLRRRFVADGESLTPQHRRDLRSLLSQLARIVRRFHAAGYNHRDLYDCHFYVRDLPEGNREIRLIDLQRVQYRRRFRRRWIVKDLAQLAWSAPRALISCRHRVLFMKAYLGVKKLRPHDKRLIRSVLFKCALMQWKMGPVEEYDRYKKNRKNLTEI